MIRLYDLEKEAEEKKALLGMINVRDHHKIIKDIQTSILESIPNPVISPETIEKPTQI